MSVEFLVTSLIVVLLASTGVLYTLTVGLGLGRGMAASVFAAAGCTLGIVPHMRASIAGVTALPHASAVAFQLIKHLGVLKRRKQPTLSRDVRRPESENTAAKIARGNRISQPETAYREYRKKRIEHSTPRPFEKTLQRAAAHSAQTSPLQNRQCIATR